MKLLLRAPLSGVLVPLEAVPDPVFAQRIAGDGVSIDPVSATLVSPCDGVVVQLHSAGHALTLATPEGVEVMLHVGIDTVELKGEGFTPRVRAGQRVAAGDPLIDFDADRVATRARSLLTQVVIPSGERVASLKARTGTARAGEDVVLELELREAAGAGAAAAGEKALSGPVTVQSATGLHARPAAVVSAAARRFAAKVELLRDGDRANAKSLVSIMGLDVGHGERVRFEAEGPDAREAVASLSALLAGAQDEAGAGPASVAAPKPPAGVSSGPGVLAGVPASPGVAVGRLARHRPAQVAVAERGEGDPRAEQRRLEAALERARGQLETLQAGLRGVAGASRAAIFAAHEELLADPELLDLATSAIDQGKSAGFAWQQAFTRHAEGLAGLHSELLAARAVDLRDVGGRVLRCLSGSEPSPVELPPDSILVAEELTPSETAGLDTRRVLGFCTTGGGATSHVAILARSLGVPAVAAIDPRALDLADGTPVVLDGGRGTLRVDPDEPLMAQVREARGRRERRDAEERAAAGEPAVTRDGRRVEVAANIGSAAEAERAVAAGAEGVGLMRSEFLFLDRRQAPSEDEQAAAYEAAARALGPERPLVVRTLDVGGDKPLAYLPQAREENPFLGERGIRLCLDRPELLREQLRAILRAAPAGRLLVMFPMVGLVSEWREARAILEEERRRLGAPAVAAGIMVEVPSAALGAESFAPEVDFFSIGTNDLTQYTLAMDRGHPRLASRLDGLHPAVLRLVAATVTAAHRHGKWVGVCGGLASDPQALPLLIGLGVDELSVDVPSLARVKARVRGLVLAECRRLAERALAAEDAAAVRALVPPEED